MKELYDGHEIACHGVYHEYPTHLNQEGLLKEYYEDRKTLEEKTGRIVRGCSYAFGEYDQRVIDMLKNIGIVYSRTVESTGSFKLPEDFMKWTPSCHHNDAFGSMAESFLHTPEYMKLPLFYIWGHSFEFDRQDNWQEMEAFCEKISGQEDTWYTTNIDYVDYMTAARNLIFSIDGTQIVNHSKLQIYAKVDGKKVIL